MRFLAARQSLIIAVVLSLTLAGWLFSGRGQEPKAAADATASSSTAERPLTQVRIREIVAQPIRREVTVSGRTEPSRDVTLRSEADGRIIDIVAERGARLQAGDAIARLDRRDREARLAEAQAAVHQAELEFEGAERLQRRKLQSETQSAQASAALEAARARLRLIEVEVENTEVRAPFAGVLEQRAVEIGDYVMVGDDLGRVLEQDPLIVVGDVSQDHIHAVLSGAPATAKLFNGGPVEVEGRLRYVASQADAATRTFRVELEIPNPEARFKVGITAEIAIPLEQVAACRLTPALLTLGDNGQIGVKTVAEDDTVMFHTVDIIRTEPDGVWVTGLPKSSRVITVGQGFVRAGQTVKPVLDDSAGGRGGPVEAPRKNVATPDAGTTERS